MEKLEKLNENAEKTGLKINRSKTKFMAINDKKNQPVKIGGEYIEKVEKFTYLGSQISNTGGTEDDIKSRINQAQCVFYKLRQFWNSKAISTNTKVKIFNSNIKSVLLYGAESWKGNKNGYSKLQTFINKCLRKILRVYWPNKITNKELWKRTNQEPVEIEILKRKWCWIGHTLRKDERDITKESLEWNPQGARKKGRPVNTWRRTVHREAKEMSKSWNELKIEAKNRGRWRSLVAALCSLRNQEDK